MASGGRRAVLSLTTRFCLPHQGMATLDYLSRYSSTFLCVRRLQRTPLSLQLAPQAH